MTERLHTVVIGAGHAGLAMSRVLTDRGIEHAVLEGERIAERWRSERWASFRLLTPNWATWLPGWRYTGPEPDGFMTAPEVVRYLEDYAASFAAPVRTGVHVRALEDGGGVLRLRTGAGEIEARHVVVATGAFQAPHVPPVAAALPAGIVQVHSRAYRSPGALPPGPVLVVGTGASGQQIADELVDAGRRVYLSVGRNRRVPRSYRGRDHFWWLEHCGYYERTADDVPAEQRRGGASPALTGARGPAYDLDLRAMAARGATLLGRLARVEGTRAYFAADLPDSVARGDRGYDEFADWAESRLDRAPAEVGEREPRPRHPDPPELSDPPLELDLDRIGTIVWATGFRPAFGSWIRLPVFEADGRPRHHRGVTDVPGLFFLGLHWLHRQRSAFIRGAQEDAEHIAGLIVA